MRVAILIEDGFEQVEDDGTAESARRGGRRYEDRLAEAAEGARLEVHRLGRRVPDRRFPRSAVPADFDALLLPGGVLNPDRLRIEPRAVAFAKSFFDAAKPVAAICHGPWTVIETGAARGRRIASWPSLKTDLRNAGAEWVDREVVVDGNLVLSRKPDDIPAFKREMIALFGRARRAVGAEHREQAGLH
ncbi:type 1 glutamine amidotransferase domain-containing protein [Anaeromyxobacter sp. Fw109-5]|uniref:type 1 glutamine amidotransferase domain-containing protein n=1 Tax=Anaeromyxobacter sp. (strain Fw109-5) TaxID=404589 RepID=UPI0013050FF5|nr:type 1 glutamine amidotransferase domain-containing protein [Anaeromyxobacter sp. Fw109-5]